MDLHERFNWSSLLVEGPRTPARWLALPVFMLATLGAFLGKEMDRPVTSAVIYLMGVIVIGGGWGLRLGVLSAVAASLIYNLLLTEPTLVFTFASADEYVPLIAFNAAALLSGALAGRLNERAQAAENAGKKLNVLLELSRRLQGTNQVKAVGRALAETCDAHQLGAAELFVLDQGRFVPASPSSAFLAEAFRADDAATVVTGNGLGSLSLAGSQGRIGVLVYEDRKNGAMDWSAAAVLLAVALERCLLLRAAAEKEALRESEAFKTALLSSVSHDLRTPLAAITASASSLSSYGDQLSSEDRESMLNVIQGQCARLDRYTRNLLSLGRLQSDPGDEGLAIMDLREILGSAISSVRAIAPAHAISKSLPDREVLVRANPVMVEQILYNVLENAVQYSAPGSTVDVKLCIDGGRAQVSVTDEGRGIPPDELERVFDRFYRSSSSAGVEGQGLGLSIARGVAERFGGSIRATSPVSGGRGARIEISLPVLEESIQ